MIFHLITIFDMRRTTILSTRRYDVPVSPEEVFGLDIPAGAVTRTLPLANELRIVGLLNL